MLWLQPGSFPSPGIAFSHSIVTPAGSNWAETPLLLRLARGCRVQNEGSVAIRQIDSPPFLADWAGHLPEGKRISAAWLMLRNALREQPLSTGASAGGLQEKGVKEIEGSFGRGGTNLAHVARRWKQVWIRPLCRSWKVTREERSRYTCCLLTVFL